MPVLWAVCVAVLAGVAVAFGGPAGRPAQAAEPRESGAVVLMYHRFGEPNFPSTNITLAQFDAHLAELRKPAYTVLPVAEIVARLRRGERLPDRTVGITIDDAYASILSEAWPRLRDAGFPFTIFVATEPIDRGFRDMLTWEQLRTLVGTGLVTLGNHTVSHLHMVDASTRSNRDEIRQAGDRIARETGQRPRLFAYPYGEAGTTVRKLVEAAGFDAAFGQHSGAIGGGMDPLMLPRFALNEHYGTFDRFKLAVNALPLAVRDVIPLDARIDAQNNPPLIGLTVAEPSAGLERLACYVSGQGRLTLSRIGARRLEGRPAKPLPAGRSRVNCTLPAGEGRWRWYGRQFYLPAP